MRSSSAYGVEVRWFAQRIYKPSHLSMLSSLNKAFCSEETRNSWSLPLGCVGPQNSHIMMAWLGEAVFWVLKSGLGCFHELERRTQMLAVIAVRKGVHYSGMSWKGAME
jgi:hypothetical protein